MNLTPLALAAVAVIAAGCGDPGPNRSELIAAVEHYFAELHDPSNAFMDRLFREPNTGRFSSDVTVHAIDDCRVTIEGGYACTVDLTETLLGRELRRADLFTFIMRNDAWVVAE